MPLLRNKRRCDHYGSDSGIIQTPNLSDPFDISNHPDIHYQAMYLLPGCCRHSATTPIKLLNAVRLLVLDSTQFSKRLSFPFQWTIWTEVRHVDGQAHSSSHWPHLVSASLFLTEYSMDGKENIYRSIVEVANLEMKVSKDRSLRV